MNIYPLCDEQKYIFDVNEGIQGIPMNVSFVMEFKQYFSVDELRCAIETCILSADISGARCVVKDGRPYMEFLPPETPDIQAHHFANTEAFELFRDSITESKVNNRDKLYHIAIYAIAGSVNHIHFCFNHMVFDGISGILLCYKIQNVLLDQQKKITWHPFSVYLEKINRYNKSEKYLADQIFWEERFAEIAKCDYLFKDVLDVEIAPIKELVFQSSESFKKGLLAFCDEHKLSPHLLIVTVLAELIYIKTGCERFYFEIPIGNRLGAKEKDSLGVYEIGPPFIFDFNKYHGLAELLQSVQKQSRDYYKHKDFDWNNKIFSAPYVEKYGEYNPQFLFSYFSYSKDYAVPFVSWRHLQTKSSFLPITLYISDFADCATFSFSYVFWDHYFSSEEIIDIHQMIESRISNFIEKGLAQTMLDKQ